MSFAREDRAYDVAVVGLGAVGGAALYQLARRGVRAIGIDRFYPPHDRGSSHGETRIMRQAIGEGAHYTPFVLRANRIWEACEEELGVSLLERCGFLFITRDDAGTSHHARPAFLTATRDAAVQYGIDHEVLDAAGIARRFSQFTGLCGDEQAYYEPGGGYLRPERCIAAQLELARRHGATIRTDTRVLGIEPQGEGILLRTSGGDVGAARAIVAAGAWLPQLADAGVSARLMPARQVLHWFPLDDASAWREGATPTFIWTHGLTSTEQFYGFPPIDGEVKVAEENLTKAADPELVGAEVEPWEQQEMARHVAGRLAGMAALPVRSERCLYTLTPDQDFLVGTHPESGAIRIVSACSGHGFKHAAAIGESLAGEAAGDSDVLSLASFAASRFGLHA